MIFIFPENSFSSVLPLTESHASGSMRARAASAACGVPQQHRAAPLLRPEASLDGAADIAVAAVAMGLVQRYRGLLAGKFANSNIGMPRCFSAPWAPAGSATRPTPRRRSPASPRRLGRGGRRLHAAQGEGPGHGDVRAQVDADLQGPAGRGERPLHTADPGSRRNSLGIQGVQSTVKAGRIGGAIR